MGRYRATISYDGTDFQGFQRQRSGVPTVQSALEVALASIVGEPVGVLAAGRTDTGVHATGQVIAFDLNWRHEERALMAALNANLPESVAVVALQLAPPDFHPRFDAVSRQYQYTLVSARHRLPLEQRTAWVLTNARLSISAMEASAERLLGRQDFAALGTPPQGESTVRTIWRAEFDAQDRDDGLWLTFTMEADAFLYRMVRRTVGMLVDVGRGQLSGKTFAALLASTQLAQGVTIAPPQGLVLTRVTYPE
ncbi:MAG: tRNA pseudouridine(38-40) synthase TruA [Phototrophicaceae bacterium]|jgi:tRNA pseudouridine38-40 synthase